MTAYETLGKLRKENKERHRDAQCPDTLQTVGLCWDDCLTEFSIHVWKKEVSTWSPFLHIFSFSGRGEMRKKEERNPQHPVFLQSTGSQFQRPFYLSHLLWCKGSKKSLFVSANVSFYRHGLMQNDTPWSKKPGHTLTETVWKVSLTRAWVVLADRRATKQLGCRKGNWAK